MQSTRRKLMTGLAMTLLGAASAFAQTAYPDKPIRLIVPFSPGGTTDILARHFGQRLSETLGTPVLIENKTGAGTMIGADYVAKSPADGYTLFVGTPSLWMNPILYKKAPYTMDAFVPVSTIARAPFVLSVSPTVEANSLKELVGLGKANPGKLSYGILGLGGPSHLVGQLFEQTVGISAVDVPYRGSAPVMTDLVGGRINFYFDGIGTSMPMQRSGKIKIFAVTSTERSPAAPDIPTFKELGYPELEADTIWGVFAPAATPPAIVARLSTAFQQIARSEDLRATLMANGTAAQGSTSQEFAALIDKDLGVWGRLARQMNLQLD